jgi:hypothetical protein
MFDGERDETSRWLFSAIVALFVVGVVFSFATVARKRVEGSEPRPGEVEIIDPSGARAGDLDSPRRPPRHPLVPLDDDDLPRAPRKPRPIPHPTLGPPDDPPPRR